MPEQRTLADGDAATADVGDVHLAYEIAGPDDGPAVLLISGLGTQRIAWPPQLREPLAAAGCRVIWFDNRDVGWSTWLPHVPPVGLAELIGSLQAGQLIPPPYTLADMAADAVGLLDHLGVEQAVVLGVSMGGMVAQRVAIHHPDRVLGLVSVMSSTGDPSLPGATPAATEALLTPAPADRDGYVAAMLAKRRVLGSPGLAWDEAWVRSTIEASHERLHPAGFLRQYHAILADGDRTPALAGLDVPTVVVHGNDDPLIPVEAGRATAAAIPGAHLEVVEGMGHDLPPAACDRLVDVVRGLLER